MIIDALLSLATWVVGFLSDTLPTGSLPDLQESSLLTAIAKLDSLVPIGPLVTMALGVLSAVVVFVLVRLTLTLWNLIWP